MREILRQTALEVSEQVKDGLENIPRNEGLDVITIMNWIYMIIGMVAVIVIIYNAVMYLMSEGDPSRVKKATQGLIFAAVGLAVVLLATVITNFIFTTIGEAS